MLKEISRIAVRLLSIFFIWGLLSNAHAEMVQGIYLTQYTLEDTTYLKYLIEHAKAVGINTFVIDLEKPSQHYKDNIALVKASNIRYVARVVVFPDGGRPEQIASPAYWAKRYELMKSAIAFGAQEIQLDYIRYNTKQPASSENAKNVVKVIAWFKSQLAESHIPLQADVFGIASFGESKHIGQNLKMIGQTVDALCPMVYPSHFEPYREHALKPYQTIFSAMKAVQGQFDNKMPTKLYAYIELSNYRYPLSGEKRSRYIAAQIQAVKDSGADGWYAWSAHNQYDYLFRLLGEYQQRVPGNIMQAVESSHLIDTMNTEEEVSEVATSTTATPTVETQKPKTPVVEAKVETKIETKTETNTNATKNVSFNTSTLLPWPLGARHFIY